MAGVNIGVCEFDSVVIALDVYKTIWTPLVDETLQLRHVGRYQ